MNRTLMLAALALALAPPALSAAEKGATKIYKCKNEKGELYYSQTFDAARCGGGGAQLNDQGIAVKEIERKKTPEEIAADKERLAREAEARKAEEEQRKADQVLIQSYASEDDLKRAHEQQIQVIEQAIATSQKQVENQQRSLAELLATAAEAERSGKPVPPAVSTNIGVVRKRIEEQNAFVAHKEQDRNEAQKEFEVRLARYRDIKAKQAEQLKQAAAQPSGH